MFKKKIIVAVLLSAILVSSLSACSSTSSQSSSGTISTETDTATSESVSTDSNSSSESNKQSTSGNPPSGPKGGGAIDKSGDLELQSLIADEEGKFQQFEYTDSETGKTLPYNLYIPTNYDSTKSYPMVLFIADSSVVGKDTTAPLTQGYGALVWVTQEAQEKHECFVLVPEYPEKIIDDHGSFTTTDYVELTKRMLESAASSYSVDMNRLYGTGQSMGCMTILYLSAKYPDLFTAELFVSGQWDINTLSPLANQKFFYIAAEGDPKASAGQAEVKTMLDSAGTKYSTVTWDATWTSDEFSTAVSSILSEGNSINMATFKLGTVLPEGVAVGTSEHMYSFDYAYKIEGVRDWLFEQIK